MAAVLLRELFTTNSLLRFGHVLAVDFGPSISLLVAILAIGAWLVGVNFEVARTHDAGAANWL
jgi:hypothetical protein